MLYIRSDEASAEMKEIASTTVNPDEIGLEDDDDDDDDDDGDNKIEGKLNCTI